MKWMQLKYVFRKASKKQTLMVITQKSASKDLNLSYLFSENFATFFKQTLSKR